MVLSDYSSFIELSAAINLIFGFWSQLRKRIPLIFDNHANKKISLTENKLSSLLASVADDNNTQVPEVITTNITLWKSALKKAYRFKANTVPIFSKGFQFCVAGCNAFSVLTAMYCICLLWQAGQAETATFELLSCTEPRCAWLLYSPFAIGTLIALLFFLLFHALYFYKVGYTYRTTNKLMNELRAEEDNLSPPSIPPNGNPL